MKNQIFRVTVRLSLFISMYLFYNCYGTPFEKKNE